MDTTATLEPPRTVVEAGQESTITLSLRNDSEIVEDYALEVVGELGRWSTVEPAHVSVFPGQSVTAAITFRPPRSSAVPAGEHAFGVHVRPAKRAENATVPEGAVELLPFYDTAADLSPQSTRSKRDGQYRVSVDNRGNAPVAVALAGKSSSDGMELVLSESDRTVEPGATWSAEARAKPVERRWWGTPVVYPFTVVVRPAEGPELTLAGTQYQDPVLPAYTFKALLGVVALFVALALGIWTVRADQFPPWREPEGPESTGLPTAGPETTGPQTGGPETTGPETAGPETTAPETAGPETTGPETAGPDPTPTVPTVPDSVELAAPPGPLGDPAALTTAVWPEDPWAGTVDVTSIVLENPERYAGRFSIELLDPATGVKQMLHQGELADLAESQEFVRDPEAAGEQGPVGGARGPLRRVEGIFPDEVISDGEGEPPVDEEEPPVPGPIERFELNEGRNLLLAMRCYPTTADGTPQTVDRCAITFTVDGEVTGPGATG